MPLWRPPWTFPYVSASIALIFLVWAVWAAVGLRSCLGLECAGNSLVMVIGGTSALGFSIPFWFWVWDRFRERSKRP